MSSHTRLLSLGALLILNMILYLSACAYQPELKIPLVELPDDKQFNTAALLQPQQSWWQEYGSTELSSLFDELKSNNLDLATAKMRFDQARAVLGLQRTEDWPLLKAQLNTRNNYDLNTGDGDNSHRLDVSAGYEIDLWGRRNAATFSLELSIVIRQQQYQSQLLQLQAALAKNYFELLSVHERLGVAQQNLQASQLLLTLIRRRFEAGSVSGIALSQQRNTWLSSQAHVLDLERSLLSRRRALAILLGRASLNLPPMQSTLSDLIVPAVKPTQAAALLEFRPDIQLAQLQWRLSEAALYQEKKKRWPSLTLSVGMEITDLLDGGEGWLASSISSLSAPFFNAGRIRQQIKVAQSELSIHEVNYRKTVLVAMQEVLETLNELKYQQNLLFVREQELANNQKLYGLAKLRFDSGDSDFISLLRAQRSWFKARDRLLQAKKSQLLSTVNVFKAMGVAPDLSVYSTEGR